VLRRNVCHRRELTGSLIVLAAIGTTGVAFGLWFLPVTVIAVATGVVLVRARRLPAHNEPAGEDPTNALER
jgi:cytochrome c-type biogenesis protein CcmH/NrfF